MKINKLKLARLLCHKKYRSEYKLFLVEGEKSIAELFNSDWELDYLLTTNYFFDKYKNSIQTKNISYEIISRDDIERAGTLESNDSAIAIVKQRDDNILKIDNNETIIALDNIQDPGNLGTIIRTADWYGVKKVIASKDSVDLYNPKVISASKGSFTRVGVFYKDLNEFLQNTDMLIIGSFLDGENVHQFDFPSNGVLVLGNESRGVSEEIKKLIDKKITIPFDSAQDRPSNGRAQSLNVSIATAIILDNWKRSIV